MSVQATEYKKMTERDELLWTIDGLSDERIPAVLNFVKDLQDDSDGFYDPANIEWLKQSIEQAKQGKIVVKTMEELERMADE